MHSKLDFVGQPRQIFSCLSQLCFTFTFHGALAPTVEEVISEVNAKRAEVTRQERDVVLVTVTGVSVNIRYPHICFSQTDGGRRESAGTGTCSPLVPQPPLPAVAVGE